MRGAIDFIKESAAVQHVWVGVPNAEREKRNREVQVRTLRIT